MGLCGACGAANPDGQRFCSQCGNALSIVCAACGSVRRADERFCGDCGAPLGGTFAVSESATVQAPVAERRLVTVLFADLVGFTTASEGRDAEDTRELLSRYFDACRRLVSLYGGTVEKFIGDAVMAVWGAPVANEDDAERAVRAALDLLAAIPELDPNLAARAGVLTGEAAVTVGASGEGMVAGDLVNTAARVQTAADPGTVLVGASTKRASEAAIAYQDAGAHELKGKSEPIELWRALRVTATRGGALKAEGLEPPFVGRDRELRLIKELFHASADERKANLVSVVGIAGIGKSRLAWEFFKYLDGLADTVWWHRGRCLAYGDGVAYWALAEMVRMRAGIADTEAVDSALTKLRTSLEEHISDPDERQWLEPRLAHLLGLAERTAPDREDLFSALRLFFERLAEHGPTVLVFEDLQWADPSLLDFVEYLLDWSRAHPLFVLALTRPELAERRPAWGAAGRNATTLVLEPLSAPAMEELIDGLVPGLTQDLRGQILDRAEGVPLYAVETVRMLLDRGLLTRDGGQYGVCGPIDALEIPETLHALIAARLDGLAPAERRVLQDASVLGKSFTKAGLAALSGLGESDLDPVVAALIRKEIVSVHADPRSPERGQYTFLQDLLKRVAYETQSRNDRKARHLAAARYLEDAWSSAEQEIVEVVAAHYLDAYRAVPDADDAPAIKARARERLALAGERAVSLAANAEASRYFVQAAELAETPLQRAQLLEGAGIASTAAGSFDAVVDLLEQAAEIYQSEGETHPAARVSARLGWAMWFAGDIEGGSRLLESAFEVLVDEEPDADLAELAEVRARLRFFMGDRDGAAERVERALEIAEALYIPSVLVDALDTKHLTLYDQGRQEEAIGLLKHAIEIGRRHDLGRPLTRALYNLGHGLATYDDFAAALEADREALELARKRGDRGDSSMAVGHMIGSLFELGEWDEARSLIPELHAELADRTNLDRVCHAAPLLASIGEMDDARGILAGQEALRTSGEVQARVGYLVAQAMVNRLDGQPEQALAAARAAIAPENYLPPRHVLGKRALIEAVESALAAGDVAAAAEALDEWDRLRPVDRTPLLEGHALRFRAAIDARRGAEDGVDEAFTGAEAIFREALMPFRLAVTLLEHAEWLTATGREGEATELLTEARSILLRLQAKPWLDRLDVVGDAAVTLVR
jgi:class 3 adenylate cyclase/tetratricopeptide (TPR) repeat protein